MDARVTTYKLENMGTDAFEELLDAMDETCMWIDLLLKQPDTTTVKIYLDDLEERYHVYLETIDFEDRPDVSRQIFLFLKKQGTPLDLLHHSLLLDESIHHIVSTRMRVFPF